VGNRRGLLPDEPWWDGITGSSAGVWDVLGEGTGVWRRSNGETPVPDRLRRAGLLGYTPGCPDVGRPLHTATKVGRSE
jgi:hypothetical protein